MSPVSQAPADSRATTDKPPSSRRHHTVRRALIVFLAAILVSLLTAVSMIGFVALTKSLGWSAAFGVVVAVAASWILGFLIWRRDRGARGSAGCRLVIGPLVVLGCAALLSLTWLYPGTGSVRPDP